VTIAAGLARQHRSSLGDEAGVSLLETLIALMLLAIVSAGVLPLAAIAISMNETQGHVASRSAVYAQDKLEQLMALAYGDVTSDTREFPAPELGGSGLSIGGSVDPDAPVALYADYLDMEGTPIAAPDGNPPAGWYYQRLWQVTQVRPNLKQITVFATVRSSLGNGQFRPRATMTALKTSPF
jgi:hypothetical protein